MVMINVREGVEYDMDHALNIKMEKVAARLTVDNPKLDWTLLLFGAEGEGKSSMGVGLMHRLAQLTGRTFDLDHIFFVPKDMLQYAAQTQNKLIMWDEAALGALAMDQTGSFQTMLVQLLMTCRRKRHALVFCIPRFFRMKPAVLERFRCGMRVYMSASRKRFKFQYIPPNLFQKMIQEWQRTKRAPKYSRFTSLRGSFTNALPLVVDEAAYDLKKDIAIKQLGRKDSDTKDMTQYEIYYLKGFIGKLPFPLKSRSDMCRKTGVSVSTVGQWASEYGEMVEKDPLFLGKKGNLIKRGANLFVKRLEAEQNDGGPLDPLHNPNNNEFFEEDTSEEGQNEGTALEEDREQAVPSE